MTSEPMTPGWRKSVPSIVAVGGVDVDDLADQQADFAAAQRENHDVEPVGLGHGPGEDEFFQRQQRQRTAAVLQHLAAAHAVDLHGADPFQPGHEVHGNGELLGRIVAEQEQRSARRPWRPRRSSSAAPRVSSSGARKLAEGRDARRIENQGRLAVAEDRRSGQAGAVPHVAAQRLDDDLLGIVQAVDDQAEAHVSGLGDHDVLRAVAGRSCVGLSTGGESQDGVQAHQGQQRAAEPQDFRVLHPLDLASPFRCASRAPARRCSTAGWHSDCRRCARSGRE